MKELYRKGTKHIARLDKRNVVLYDSRSLKVKDGSESYDYKYYPDVCGAVLAMGRAVADEKSNDLGEWLDEYEEITERATLALREWGENRK